MAKGLTGLRVLGLTAALSGPYCGLILADSGAEVIKIEPPGGEIFRIMGPYFQGEWSAYFVGIHRNKKGMVLNLRTDAGREALYDLVKVSDVVLDNYRPGVLERLKLTHDILSEINPRIITCSITGYGAGVYRNKTAFDACVQAASGIISITGDEAGNVCKVGVPIGDLATGQFAVIGILTALNERHLSGVGQHVDIAMFDAQLSLLTYEIPWYFLSGNISTPLGTAHRGLEPYGAYRTKDGQIMLALGTDKFWRQFCSVLGLEGYGNDPSLATATKRQARRRELKEVIERAFAERTTDEWLEILEGAGLPVAPINDIPHAIAEPCVAERNMLVPVDQPRYGRTYMAGNPVKLSRTPGEEFAPAPAIGEHTVPVLRGLLGYSEERVARMLEEGAAEQFIDPDGAGIPDISWPPSQPTPGVYGVQMVTPDQEAVKS